MQQVAIRVVDFHAVDAGVDSPARALTEFCDAARMKLEAEVDVTPAGLLSIAGLVSATRPVAMAKTVSPSKGVWIGRIARANPSCAMIATSALVSARVA